MTLLDFVKSCGTPSAELPSVDGLYLIQRPTDDDVTLEDESEIRGVQAMMESIAKRARG